MCRRLSEKNMIDIEKLKALAEAAPTGPWLAENDSLYFKDHGYTRHMLDADAGHDVEEAAYYAAIEFIPAANPAAVLELIAELSTLRSQVATLQAAPDSWQSGYDEGRKMGTKTALSERDQLKAANEALMKFMAEISQDSGDKYAVMRARQFLKVPGYE